MLKHVDLSHETEFCRIMTRFGSDKGSRHHYTRIYHYLLNELRRKEIVIGEVGIGTIDASIPSSMKHVPKYQPGASLRGWRELFPSSSVYGFDIDWNILINEGGISSYHLDMRDKIDILETFEFRLDDVFFDVFVDDGLHDENYNWLLLENIHQRIKPGGWYFIEDIPEESSIFGDFSNYIGSSAEEIRENFDFLLTPPVPENRLFILHRK